MIDLKIVRHLAAADFRQLRPLALALWVLLAIAALAPLLATTGDFGSYPLGDIHSSGSSASPEEFDPKTLREGRWVLAISILARPLFVAAATFFAIGLGCSSGGLGGVRPVRRCERVSSKLALLLLVVILPLCLAIAGVMLRQGFRLPEVGAGLASAAAVFVPLQIALLAFGAIHRSPGRALGGTLALVAIACGIGMFDPQAPEEILAPLVDGLADGVGPRRWFYLGSIALGLGALLTVRKVWSRPGAIIATAAVVVACWFGTRSVQPLELLVDEDGLTVPTIQRMAFHRGMWSDGELSYRLHASHGSEPAETGRLEYWIATSDTELWRDDERIASAKRVRRDKNYQHTPELYGSFITGTPLPVLRERFPKLEHEDRPRTEGAAGYVAPPYFGAYQVRRSDVFDTPMTVKSEMVGVAFHYQIVADLEVETGGSFEHHGVRGRTRQLTEKGGMPIVDVLLRVPALGRARYVEQVHPSVTSRAWRYFVYLPESKKLLPMEIAFSGRGASLAGGSAQRRVLRVNRQGRNVEGLGFAGARLVVTAPVIDAVARKHAVLPDVDIGFERMGRSDLYRAALTSRLPPMENREVLARRPDPRSASAADVGKWMRFSHRSGLRENSLEEYTKLQLPVLLRSLGTSLSTYAIEPIQKGASYADRKQIIAAAPARHFNMALASRGWLDEAKEMVLKGWRTGVDPNPLPVVALEDPSTYDELIELIAIGKCGPDAYEAIRQLPGLDQDALDRAVEHLFELRRALVDTSYRRVDRYEIPVRHGLRPALEESLRLLREEGVSGFEPRNSLKADHGKGRAHVKAWMKALDPDELEWDPVARWWVQTSKSKEAKQ